MARPWMTPLRGCGTRLGQAMPDDADVARGRGAARVMGASRRALLAVRRPAWPTASRGGRCRFSRDAAAAQRGVAILALGGIGRRAVYRRPGCGTSQTASLKVFSFPARNRQPILARRAAGQLAHAVSPQRPRLLRRRHHRHDRHARGPISPSRTSRSRVADVAPHQQRLGPPGSRGRPAADRGRWGRPGRCAARPRSPASPAAGGRGCSARGAGERCRPQRPRRWRHRAGR